MRSIIRVPSKVQFAESNGSCGVLSCSYTECDVVWSEATQWRFHTGYKYLHCQEQEASSRNQDAHQYSLWHPDAKQPSCEYSIPVEPEHGHSRHRSCRLSSSWSASGPEI